jgi:outer membrane PBP1 activator LpoA protein
VDETLDIIETNSVLRIKPRDRMDLMKLNFEILIKSGKTEEAQALMKKLIEEFQDNMEDEILMLNSELAIKEENVKKAVNLLKVKDS